MDKLTEARNTINEVDSEMAELFLRRMDAVKTIAEYKRENGLPVYDEAREAEIIARATDKFSDDELNRFYVEFVKNNIELSKEYQCRLLEGNTFLPKGGNE